MNTDTCDDYACERGDDNGHSHTGVRPYLRRVMSHGKLIDGKTGEFIDPPKKEEIKK